MSTTKPKLQLRGRPRKGETKEEALVRRTKEQNNAVRRAREAAKKTAVTA